MPFWFDILLGSVWRAETDQRIAKDRVGPLLDVVSHLTLGPGKLPKELLLVDFGSASIWDSYAFFQDTPLVLVYLSLCRIVIIATRYSVLLVIDNLLWLDRGTPAHFRGVLLRAFGAC